MDASGNRRYDPQTLQTAYFTQHQSDFSINLVLFLTQFRLKRCGLHKPIYLVEQCGSAAAHLSLPESTLQQAIVNTQVCTHTQVKTQYEITVRHKIEFQL